MIDSTLLTYASLVLGSYFLGSIPFGLIIVRLAGFGDIRSIGSGNIGATNVARTGNKKLALATLILDGLKGVVAIVIVKHFTDNAWCIALSGVSAVLGHMFPIWLKFKGGKGVATTIGVYFCMNHVLGMVVAAVWLMTFRRMRISSISAIMAMLASILFPIIFIRMFSKYDIFVSVFLGTIVIYRHKENIVRILKGTESKFK